MTIFNARALPSRSRDLSLSGQNALQINHQKGEPVQTLPFRARRNLSRKDAALSRAEIGVLGAGTLRQQSTARPFSHEFLKGLPLGVILWLFR